MSIYKNPFPADPDRQQMWDMLVERDIKAFLNEDWSMVQDDFIEEGFMGIDGGKASNPDTWKLNFPDLQSYQMEWLKQAKDFKNEEWAGDLEKGFVEATTLRDLEIQGNSALVHKKFDGHITKKNGETVYLNWQSLYRWTNSPAS